MLVRQFVVLEMRFWSLGAVEVVNTSREGGEVLETTSG